MLSLQYKLFFTCVLCFSSMVLISKLRDWRKEDINEEDAFSYMSKIGIDYDEDDRRLQLLSDFTDDCSLRTDFPGPDYLMFLPSLKGILRHEGQKISFVNTCFQQTTITMKSLNHSGIILEIEVDSPKTKLCKDSYYIHTSSIRKVKIIFSKGTKTVEVGKALTDDDIREINVNGLRVFSFCLGIKDTIQSIYNTIKMFRSSDNPQSIVERLPEDKLETIKGRNIDFLSRYANYTLIDRGEWSNKIIDIEDQIQSGDFIGLIQVYDWDSIFILLLSGGKITHSAIALRLDGKLYVVESAYKGIFISPYEEFIENEIKTIHTVAHFPLRKEYRDKFNETKAYEFFKKVEGKPYGSHNLFFGVIDTPNDNTPDYFNTELLFMLASLAEPFLREKISMYFGEALNLRLGTKNLSIKEITYEAARRGLTFEELLAIPEEDNWEYSNGENYVCSSLVVEMYKQAGIFDGLDIKAKEFTPRDITMLDIFDKEYKRPKQCEEADPGLPYCNIVGQWRINVEQYSSIKPYDAMNTKCPSKAPTYKRPEGC